MQRSLLLKKINDILVDSDTTTLHALYNVIRSMRRRAEYGKTKAKNN